MDEIPELVTELPENGVIKTEKVPAAPFVPSSLTPTALAKKYQLLLLLDTWVLESRLYCKISGKLQTSD